MGLVDASFFPATFPFLLCYDVLLIPLVLFCSSFLRLLVVHTIVEFVLLLLLLFCRHQNRSYKYMSDLKIENKRTEVAVIVD